MYKTYLIMMVDKEAGAYYGPMRFENQQTKKSAIDKAFGTLQNRYIADLIMQGKDTTKTILNNYGAGASTSITRDKMRIHSLDGKIIKKYDYKCKELK